MADPRFVAVLDVGKTNVKVVVEDAVAGKEVVARTMPNVVLHTGPYPHFDIARIEAFFVDCLADFVRAGTTIDAVSITAHGATGALIGAEDLALPVLDYEFEGPDRLATRYDAARPPFSETFSPRLPGGLNLGAQLFWQAATFPDEFATATILTYPQYWAWWLTGVAANEATSLGTHTDLWAPRAGNFSSLVDTQGWRGRLAPVRSAFDILGPVRAPLARRIGFDRPVPVACGLHDSNASLLPHIQRATAPLTVVSTGTWVICFAVGGTLDRLDLARDTLANVDAYARPVPSARFMGGREFDLLTGGQVAMPDEACVAAVCARMLMVLPSFAPGSGPFPKAKGRWSHDPARLSPAERTAVASLYAALMTATCLDVIAAEGATVVEGPFARNALYADALEALTGRPVLAAASGTGTSAGAARLVVPAGLAVREAEAGPRTRSYDLGDAFTRYAARWRDEVVDLA